MRSMVEGPPKAALATRRSLRSHPSTAFGGPPPRGIAGRIGAYRASSTRAWVAIWASIGAVVTGAVRARSTVRRNWSMRAP